jgi:hypothetical protein
MAAYDIHKGAGKTLEFRGLRGQYMVGFFAAVTGCFFLFAILSVAGVPVLVRVLVVLGLAGGLSLYLFRSNKRYGQHGLMKQQARRSYPRYVYRRRSFYVMLQQGKKEVKER